MKIHDVIQGSPEWHALRLGLPTASEFCNIITPGKGELSKSARRYAHTLVAEMLLGEPIDPPIAGLEWVERGKLLEIQAVQQYEFTTDTETRAVGFITTDDGRLGCSPDRLIIGQPGGLEIKCTAPQTHVGLMVDGPGEAYRPQVQGQLLVAGLEWIDLYAFHPTLPPVTIRTYRDETYLAKMRPALAEFCDMLDAMLAQARGSGVFLAAAFEPPAPPPIEAPVTLAVRRPRAPRRAINGAAR